MSKSALTEKELTTSANSSVIRRRQQEQTLLEHDAYAYSLDSKSTGTEARWLHRNESP